METQDAMRRSDALRILREHRAQLLAMKVANLRLFGSVARDEARPDSDIDLLVTFNAPVDLFDLADVKLFLETVLHRPVDLVMERSVRPQLRDRIFAEAVSVG